MPIYKTKNENFFKQWSSEMAYVLGFFTADGSMYKTKRGTHFMEFQITDGGLLKQIRKLIGSSHKIAVRRSDNPREKPIYRLQIGSKAIFGDLLKLGLTPNKSKTLRFPKIPQEYFKDFLRGYFDGDGCVYLGKYRRADNGRQRWHFSVSFTSGSKRLLRGLWNALRSYTNGGRLGTKKGGYELVFSHRDGLALFNLMYDNVSAKIFLERKYKIFQKALEALKMRA